MRRTTLYAYLLGVWQVHRSLTTRFDNARQRGAYEAGRAFAKWFEEKRLA